mgnify:CR=1 FL=1
MNAEFLEVACGKRNVVQSAILLNQGIDYLFFAERIDIDEGFVIRRNGGELNPMKTQLILKLFLKCGDTFVYFCDINPVGT